MSLQTFEKMANHLGLVRMKITDPFYPPYQPGSLAGFPPDAALRLFEGASAVPVDADGNEVTIARPAAAPAEKPVAASTVAIPENWEEEHHLSRIRLAKEIRGTTESLTADAADAIIRAEVERRKGHDNADEV